MYVGDEDDELQRLLEGRDEEVRSPPRDKPPQPARKKQRVDDVVPEREVYDMDDFIVRDPDDEVDSDGEDADRPPGQDEAIEAPAKKAVRRVTLNPRPKLDPDRLKGAKGLVSLLDQHSKLDLRGAGHEADDLNRIMFTLEHWGHMLFPKMAFDDLIEKLEQLGSKKAVSVLVKKMRQGMSLEVPKETFGDEDDDDEDIQRGLDFTVGQAPPVNAEEAFDRIFAAETDNPPITKQSVSLTEEQRQEIARKRLEAIERRRERAAREALEQNAAQSESQQAEQQDAEHEPVIANESGEDVSSQKELMDMLADAEME